MAAIQKTDADSLQRRFQRILVGAEKVRKRCFAYIRGPVPEEHQSILFILGCQRSGTTLLSRVFERDRNAKVFGEFSELSSDDRDHGIRLNDLKNVSNVFAAQRFELLVAKPLVESQRAIDLLEYFPRSRVIWLYRNHEDVISSDLRKFGPQNALNNIRPIALGVTDNWRSENVAPSIRDAIRKNFSHDMSPGDAAALFWVSRNRHILNESLNAYKDRILLLPYEHLITAPNETVGAIYNFLERKFPGQRVLSEIDGRSLGKGKGVDLSPEIDRLCKETLAELEQSRALQNNVLGRPTDNHV